MVHWLLPHLTISFAPNAQELSPLLPVPHFHIILLPTTPVLLMRLTAHKAEPGPKTDVGEVADRRHRSG